MGRSWAWAFQQTIVAREGDGGTTDNWDMNTLNETGPHAGRLLYRSHETLEAGQVSVTDLRTGITRVLVARPDWNRMDGIVWTPWGFRSAQFEHPRPEGTGNATHLGRFTVEIPHVVNTTNRTSTGTYEFTAANGDTWTAGFTGQATLTEP